MIGFNFKVDCREHNPDLFLYFDLYAKKKHFTWNKEMLEVGDIVCGNICIERKEASDFVGSIMDGRLKEQAMRMYANYPYRYIIIEGDPFRTKSNIGNNAIIGKMVSICANYGIFIINVNSPKDLVYACYSIVAKHYARNELDFVNFKNCIRKLKNEDVPVAMLCQIPNVGLDKAKLIVKFYKNCSPQELFSKICFEDLISISGIGRIIAQKIMDNIK